MSRDEGARSGNEQRSSLIKSCQQFLVYSYKVVLLYSAVVTLYSPANTSTIRPREKRGPGKRKNGEKGGSEEKIRLNKDNKCLQIEGKRLSSFQ